MEDKVFVVFKEEDYTLDRVIYMEDIVSDDILFRQSVIDRVQEIINFELDEEEYEKFRQKEYDGIESKDGTVTVMVVTKDYVKTYMKHILKAEIELWETNFFIGTDDTDILVAFKDDDYGLSEVIALKELFYDSTFIREKIIDKTNQSYEHQELEEFLLLRRNKIESLDKTVTIIAAKGERIKRHMINTLKYQLDLWEKDFFMKG